MVLENPRVHQIQVNFIFQVRMPSHWGQRLANSFVYWSKSWLSNSGLFLNTPTALRISNQFTERAATASALKLKTATLEPPFGTDSSRTHERRLSCQSMVLIGINVRILSFFSKLWFWDLRFSIIRSWSIRFWAKVLRTSLCNWPLHPRDFKAEAAALGSPYQSG